MNKKYDIYMTKEFMNKKENVCETKTIISFLAKHIVTVTRQIPYTGTNASDRPLLAAKILSCTRWPRWWSS